MAMMSRAGSSDPRQQESGGFKRYNSPSGRLFYGDTAGGFGRHASHTAANSAFASSSTSAFAGSPATTFSSRSTDFLNHRASSPTRVKLFGSTSGRPVDSIAAKCKPTSPAAPARKACMCSPTTHPGSFRCSLHKGLSSPHSSPGGRSALSSSNRLNARRSAMTNSLVRIGTVEGEWVKRALAALIRPSSHQQRRREAFHPQPSRLSVMSKATGTPV